MNQNLDADPILAKPVCSPVTLEQLQAMLQVDDEEMAVLLEERDALNDKIRILEALRLEIRRGIQQESGLPEGDDDLPEIEARDGVTIEI